jgi:hypothetical protein
MFCISLGGGGVIELIVNATMKLMNIPINPIPSGDIPNQ